MEEERALDQAHEHWRKILPSLEDTRWDFRTVAGIARDTGLPERSVSEALEEHDADLRARMYRYGEQVFTLKSRPRSLREVLADIRLFASKSY